MMLKDEIDKYAIAQKEGDTTTWFLFRPSGTEVVIKISEGDIVNTNYPLSKDELGYINKHIKLNEP